LDANGVLASAECFDAGFGFSGPWQPQILAFSSSLSLGGSLTLSGSGFRGIAGGSAGNTRDSSANYPLLQVRAVEGGQSVFLPLAAGTNWSSTTFTSVPVSGLPVGYALATVFANGIPSVSVILSITAVPMPTPIFLSDSALLPSGAFQFTFTNAPGATFSVWFATELATPMANWSAAGSAAEVTPGQFQFSDLQAANLPRRFYQVRSP